MGDERIITLIANAMMAEAYQQLLNTKPSLMFLGSFNYNLSRDFEREYLQGQSLMLKTPSICQNLPLKRILRKAFDAAWGKGTFNYLLWANSKKSVKKPYPKDKLPEWAASKEEAAS